MQEIFITGRSLPEAYHRALVELETNGALLNCSDWNQTQKECAMTVYVEKPLEEPMISRLIIGGAYDLQRYLMELLDGILDFRIGNGWDYTYHDRFSAYIPFVIDELKRNKDSRRAVISIRDNEIDSRNKDAACLQSIQFFIRDNRLDCMTMFRSNDLPEAFFFNAFGLIMLQKRIAAQLSVEVGTYTHRSNSMHCYEKDFPLLTKYVKAVTEKEIEDLTYNYRDEWDEFMEAEVPNIMKLVENLKINSGA
jgi:thymidylate synthase